MTNGLINRPKVSLCTLGCKVNQYESQSIAEDFERLGFVVCEFTDKCDVYIINTCTVTAESDKKSRQMIRRARKTGGQNCVVIAIGCFTQAQKDAVIDICELDAAFGNEHKNKVAELAMELLGNKKSFINRITDISLATAYDDMHISRSERTRAFVKIVDGCENHCSYCIIPSVRGKIRSRSPENIRDEVQVLAENGYKEIVLTGIETAAYGKDIGCSLSQVLKMCDAVEGIERIRLGSLEPTVIKDDFIDAISSMKHAVPHFHLSLQSGSDSVLRGMRRKYNTAMFYDKLCKLKAALPDATFTTDIIVGFPGETQQHFEETCEFVKKCGFLYVHIFPYSKRAETDAAVMQQQVPQIEKKERASILKQIMLETRIAVLKNYDGKVADVLFEEKSDDGLYIGHTQHYIEAKLTDIIEDPSGQIHKCKLIYDGSHEYMKCTLAK